MWREHRTIDEPAPLSCMGGWCHHREHCALYHAADRRNPIERMCERGSSEVMPEPLRVRAVATYRMERAA